MPKFYHIDVSNGHEDAIDFLNAEHAAKEAQSDQDLQDYYREPPMNKLFRDYCDGKITKEEYERENETAQSVAEGTVGVLATEPDNDL